MPGRAELEAARVLKRFAGQQNVTTNVLIKPKRTEECRWADHKLLSLPRGLSEGVVA